MSEVRASPAPALSCTPPVFILVACPALRPRSSTSIIALVGERPLCCGSVPRACRYTGVALVCFFVFVSSALYARACPLVAPQPHGLSSSSVRPSRAAPASQLFIIFMSPIAYYTHALLLRPLYHHSRTSSSTPPIRAWPSRTSHIAPHAPWMVPREVDYYAI
jgi:hypothetical protein